PCFLAAFGSGPSLPLSARALCSGKPVADLDHLDPFDPDRRPQFDHIALLRLEQGAGDRRYPAYPAAIGISPIDANDRHDAFGTMLILVCYSCTEEHAVAIFLPIRVDHLGDFQALRQEARAPIDFAQAALAVEVVAVLRAIAIAGGPGDHLDDFR